MDFKDALEIADTVIFAKTGKHLTDVETIILDGSWQNQRYEEIADGAGYSTNYIQKDVGTRLWKKLSDALGEEVGKKNFRQALARQVNFSNDRSFQPGLSRKITEFPQRPLALDSTLYIERPPVESLCYREVVKAGALMRIKAPRMMGKTSLLNRILAEAERNGCRTAYFSLRQIEKITFGNLDKFLRQFCANITSKLQLPLALDKYWDEELFGSMTSCKEYVQSHLLENQEGPLVLGLDDVERLFEYPEIAQDFFALLRGWHEEAKNLEIWQQLRLAIAHSTESYIPLNINISPFNVGLPIKLLPFTLEQIQLLARHYELKDFADSTVEKIKAMVGGHPYLVQLAFYYLQRGDVSLEKLLAEAPTQSGIYSDHLRGLLELVLGSTELTLAMKKVLEVEEGIQIEPKLAYQLESLGLVEIDKNMVNFSCKLYRLFFRDHL